LGIGSFWFGGVWLLSQGKAGIDAVSFINQKIQYSAGPPKIQ
jgi:hypothetical protein